MIVVTYMLIRRLVVRYKVVEAVLTKLGEYSPSELEELLGVPMRPGKPRAERTEALLSFFSARLPDIGIWLHGVPADFTYGCRGFEGNHYMVTFVLSASLRDYLTAPAAQLPKASITRTRSLALKALAIHQEMGHEGEQHILGQAMTAYLALNGLSLERQLVESRDQPDGLWQDFVRRGLHPQEVCNELRGARQAMVAGRP